jgi:hypothetical protein
MTTNRNWYNFPIHRTELDNMIAAIVGTALASGAGEEYLTGFLAAAQAIATAAGLYYEAPSVSNVTVEAPPAHKPMRLTGPFPR